METKFDTKELLRPALLALADGTVFKGRAFGTERGLSNPVVGEVVFNTSMYGYQEILTDPSYAGQILCFTYPHIGNVGCNPEDVESAKMHAEGLVIRDLSKLASNFRATQTLSQYLVDEGKMGIAGIDTRQIVAHLRDRGAQMGAIACGENLNKDDLVDIARKQGSMAGKDYVQYVSCKTPYSWTELPWSLEYSMKKPAANERRGFRKLREEDLWQRPHVVALDCGIKYSILRLLLESGFRVTAAPATATTEEILALKPDALFLSNGPGDPATLGYIVSAVKPLVGKVPTFGICLGHQILGQVFGGKTYKLKFGHRGGNHPVIDKTTGKVEITVQNHGFAVDPDSLPKKGNVSISHLNLNDRTVEGLEAPDLRAFCVQYHPEASPGPHDSRYLFKRFFESVVR
jgi:carbamoyl-phosphate synthase small subunit